MPAPDRINITRVTGPLPSRAAANLFWVARYVERAEATLRLVRALVNRVSDSDEAATRVVGQLCSLLGAWDAVPTEPPYVRPVLVVRCKAAISRARFPISWARRSRRRR